MLLIYEVPWPVSVPVEMEPLGLVHNTCSVTPFVTSSNNSMKQVSVKEEPINSIVVDEDTFTEEGA